MAHQNYFVTWGTKVMRGLNNSNWKRNTVKYTNIIISWSMPDEFLASVSQSMREDPRTSQRMVHPEKNIPALPCLYV